MDTIKPEKDEVDRFHSQRRPSKPAAKNDVPATAPSGEKAAAGKEGLSKPVQFALVLIFIMLIGFAGVGFWQVNSQQETIQTLEQQLEQARLFISQSKLITARLEGQINQTDATMAQSGNEMARELKFLDSEVRKLWDVSNKRNKQWIQDNQKALESLQSDLAASNQRINGLAGEVSGLVTMDESLSQSISEQAQKLAAQEQKLSSDISGLKETTGELQAAQGIIDSRLSQGLKTTEDRLDSQAQTLARLERESSKLSQQNIETRLADIEQNLGALDKTRNQLVQRFVELDKRVNELKLELGALQSQSGKPQTAAQ